MKDEAGDVTLKKRDVIARHSRNNRMRDPRCGKEDGKLDKKRGMRGANLRKDGYSRNEA